MLLTMIKTGCLFRTGFRSLFRRRIELLVGLGLSAERGDLGFEVACQRGEPSVHKVLAGAAPLRLSAGRPPYGAPPTEDDTQCGQLEYPCDSPFNEHRQFVQCRSPGQPRADLLHEDDVLSSLVDSERGGDTRGRMHSPRRFLDVLGVDIPAVDND